MRGRVLVLAVALGLAAAFLTRGASPLLPPAPAASAPAPALASEATPAPVHEFFDRDPFRYLDDAESRPTIHTPPPIASQPAEPQSDVAPAPLRLVGLIRQGEELRAALSIHGVVVTAVAGEVVEGYEVLSIDEDVGVVLRDARGAEVSLLPK